MNVALINDGLNNVIPIACNFGVILKVCNAVLSPIIVSISNMYCAFDEKLKYLKTKI